MTKFLKFAAVPSALTAAIALGSLAPAAAMPKQPGLASTVDGVTLVASKKPARHVRRYRDDYANDGYAGNGSGWGYYDHTYDTVGSTGYNGTPYGYNRYSGRQNFECKIDLGYGRTTPCDAGGIR